VCRFGGESEGALQLKTLSYCAVCRDNSDMRYAVDSVTPVASSNSRCQSRSGSFPVHLSDWRPKVTDRPRCRRWQAVRPGRVFPVRKLCVCSRKRVHTLAQQFLDDLAAQMGILSLSSIAIYMGIIHTGLSHVHHVIRVTVE
jgi:hypothetical protein